jgi:RsiW-degrading membrane proteinase PrsW (M82 family)
VDFQLSAVLGVVFGVLAAACAFVISYGEYKRNWSFRGSAWKMALRSALVTFAFFFLAALLLAGIFRLVM